SAHFTILSDVDTPLCGKHGAAPVFGPQKGATPEQVEVLSKGLANFAAVAAGNLADVAGGGAGGGIAGALHRFFNASIVPGADTVLELGGFDTIASAAHLIFTGEGSLDHTTLCGKAPMAVLRRAQALGKAVVAIGGRVDAREALIAAGFEAVEASTPAGTPVEVAMNTEFATAALGRAVENYLRRRFNR
ncbi:MAG: glycerate kinase, partial [Muribaculaceae bacterium]|nr:glycerate kinase [Muribaculaceae bacterium]